MKHLGKSRLRLALHILIVLSIIGILYSAFILFLDSREYAKGNAANKQLRLIWKSSEPAKDQANESLRIISEVPSKKRNRSMPTKLTSPL